MGIIIREAVPLLPGESEQHESDICTQAGQDCKALGKKRLSSTMNDCLLALLTIPCAGDVPF